MATHSSDKAPNELVHESSPYLLQHAYNPVNWLPWGEKALQKAKTEDKPILVSIGYSSCHWCHVMERESFESNEIAAIMNRGFINIKVDREERPDVDQIYMDALQSMNIQGGWPLNVFLTPDAKPFYGGTYFPPSHWVHLLNQISNAFKDHREELEKSANDFTRVLNYSDIVKYDLKESSPVYTKEELDQMFTVMERNFDRRLGGTNKSPKFPMPSIYLFLLRYFHISKNEAALKHVKLTLDKMAMGGIYDQIGGGFARYSTDAEWFAPHFEKMLYDNGQLVSLYSEAFTLTGVSLYKEVVYETISFIEREMTNSQGGFYSALDADSEGIEGNFYVWNWSELQFLLKEDLVLFSDYYNVREGGNWEHDFNILNRTLSDIAFANKHKLSLHDLNEKISQWKSLLLKERSKKVRPGLDDKILTSWNGLMLKGLVDAYRAFDEKQFLDLAIKNAEFIKQQLLKDQRLFHTWKNGKASIEGYLEDYAFVIQAYISLYQASFDEQWLHLAKELTQYAFNHFFDQEEKMFFFTSDAGEKLIARKKEIFDNVIPSSNSSMAINLNLIGKYFDNSEYITVAESMTSRIKKMLLAEPAYLGNWGCLFTSFVSPGAEIAISGKEYINFRKEIDKNYLPHVLFAGTATKSNLPLLEGREAGNGETRIFVCHDKTCKLPVNSVGKALDLI